MPITRKFRETVWARAQDDARFRAAMLTEAVNELLAGDLEAGKAMLRDYVNATLTFDGLAKETGKPNKSLQRMLGPRGNPTAESLFRDYQGVAGVGTHPVRGKNNKTRGVRFLASRCLALSLHPEVNMPKSGQTRIINPMT